jgi:ubiquinone/menaquinone biosynthesis C-methylase UbiE
MSSQSEVSRVTRTKKEAQRSYDRISRWYDILEGVWEKQLREKGLDKLQVQEGETVLEIGFGPGHDLISIARSVGASGKVYGIDLAPQMVSIAQQWVDQANLTSRVELKQGDAAQLPYPSDKMDAIFMSFTLELFDTPEIPQVLIECKRVLQPGGRIGVVSLSKAQGTPWMVRLYEWGHTKMPKLLDCRPIFVRHSLEDAGFSIQEAHQDDLLGLPVEIVIGSKQD